MFDRRVKVPLPQNEPVLEYREGSKERKEIEAKLEELRSTEPLEIPLIIGGKEVRTGKTKDVVMPTDHGHILARYHLAGEKEVQMAIEAALEAHKIWSAMSYTNRLSIFLKMAELLSGPYRMEINAASMLALGKNVHQAEIDAACELIDFLRFNAYYAQQIYDEQPLHSPKGVWNYVEYRALEGFVLAVTPFNFTAISGNLPSSPAMMGNVILWKPASGGPVYTGYKLMQLFREAGLPDGVINFIPGPGSQIGEVAMDSKHLAGIHFTGSTPVFQYMWKKVGENIQSYKTYPRIVGETGGKDFIVVHDSADLDEVTVGAVRGAFEYQGQKCSAASRMYVPKKHWPTLKEKLGKMLAEVKMGDVGDFTTLVNAVIDEKAFKTITKYIDDAKNSSDAEIVFGGTYDKSKGYFIEPTVILAKDPHYTTMEEEIFGPVLTIYVYEDDRFEEVLELCDQTSIYGLTGAIFAKDRLAVNQAMTKLRFAAGNFYVNDKPTGSVVGQQPFGGSRASGTNDKAGSTMNLLRWVSMRAIKENFNPPKDFQYPHMRRGT